MSQEDRDKWNQRYAEGAYATREHPSSLLLRWLPRLQDLPATPRALDVACGLGRNSLYLAGQGWQVDGLDVSERALAGLERSARERGLSVGCLQHDLEPEQGEPGDCLPRATYDLIIVFRYTNLPLVPRLAAALRPGGYLLIEAHMQTDLPVIGPGTPRFRVAPGALRAAAGDLVIVDCQEGVFEDPDCRRAALARLLARQH